MNAKLLLSDPEADLVRAMLRDHLPARTRVVVFGSRAGGPCKPWSDLDLALEAEAPLPLATMAALAEAFAESALPWKVDLVDLHLVSAKFRALIDGTAVPL